MNRLAQETSPYLLQHAENPVEWYAWGDVARSGGGGRTAGGGAGGGVGGTGLAGASRRGRTTGPGAHRLSAGVGAAGGIARAAHRVAARRGRAGSPLGVRRAVGRLGSRAQVPAGVDDRVPAPARRARARHEDARLDGARRDVRPSRRRLPPLLGRRAVARAALREDALRQRAPRPRVPP